MRDKEKIKLLEKQVELLEKVVELQKAAPVITFTPVVTREVYPSYPVNPWWTPPARYGNGTGDFLPQWPSVTCRG